MTQLSISHSSFNLFKNRSRAFGWGTLSDWSVLQEVEIFPASSMEDPQLFSSIVDEDFDPTIENVSDQLVALNFGSIARFLVCFDNRTVRLVAAHPQADQNTIDHLVDDHIAPRIIAEDDVLVLHGSITLVGSRLVIFLGATGSGKSTFAASMHVAGYRLLGDDAVVISESAGVPMGESVYPSLRLFRESIDYVFGDNVETSAMAIYSDKMHVAAPNLGSDRQERYPLAAVYLLREGDSGVSLEPCNPADACIGLVENSFTLNPLDQASALKRMAKAARLAASVPCYRLSYPHDYAILAEARAQVLASLTNLSQPA